MVLYRRSNTRSHWMCCLRNSLHNQDSDRRHDIGISRSINTIELRNRLERISADEVPFPHERLALP